MKEIEFWTHNGIHFRRLSDGSVEIRCTSGGEVLDPHAWASVVAALSIHGEQNDTRRIALQFHQGR